MRNRDFYNLMRKTSSLAFQHRESCTKLSNEFERRYGVTYSEVNADPLIDLFDYGYSYDVPTIEEVDEIMSEWSNYNGNP